MIANNINESKYNTSVLDRLHLPSFQKGFFSISLISLVVHLFQITLLLIVIRKKREQVNLVYFEKGEVTGSILCGYIPKK